MPPFRTTACPRNCYSTCGMRVSVEEGRLRGLEAHPDNDTTSEGLCLKGLSYVERVYDPARILRPLERRSDGSFSAISWERALDRIAGELTRTREEFGPRSVFFYAGSGTKGLMNEIGPAFWRLFGGCTTTYGDLCWPAGLEATRLTLGANRHNAPRDLANARLIILWGKNPAETNVHQMRFIDEALDRGARLIVIDPRRTQSAESAELLVQPRPGTDGALALGIAHLLVSNDWIDHRFIADTVHGFDEFSRLAEAWDATRVEAVTGVSPGDLHHLAQAVGTVAPLSICGGFGMQRFTNSGQAVRAIIALLAITGNLGKPGAGWIYANLQSHIFSSPKDPLAFFPPAEDIDPIRVSVSTARLGRAMLETRDPELKLAWIERGNPVTQNPHTGEVLRALRGLDFRVVVDQFLTDTAREADIVLPAKTLFEQTDVINAYWHAYIQIKDKVIEPPGEVRPESEIYWHLAQRLGFEPADIETHLPAPADDAVEDHLRRRLAPWPEITLEALREAPILAPGHQEVVWSDRVFPTPSGRIELLSREAAERWDAPPLPDYREPVETPDERHPLHLLTPNTKNRIHSQFNNLPSIRALEPESRLEMSPVDAAPRGIRDGAAVRVFNDRGSIVLKARLDHSLRPGCVAVANGWWLCEGGGANLLSAARETDIAHGAAFHDNAVEVERVG